MTSKSAILGQRDDALAVGPFLVLLVRERLRRLQQLNCRFPGTCAGIPVCWRGLCVNSAHPELSFPPQHAQRNFLVVTTDGEVEA